MNETFESPSVPNKDYLIRKISETIKLPVLENKKIIQVKNYSCLFFFLRHPIARNKN